MKSPRSVVTVLAMLIAEAARACPFCDSETAAETRAGIFNDQFFPNLLAGLLPFAIVTGIALAVHVDWTRFYSAACRSKGTPP